MISQWGTTTWNTQSRNGISQSRTLATTIFEEPLCQEIVLAIQVPEIEEYMYEDAITIVEKSSSFDDVFRR